MGQVNRISKAGLQLVKGFEGLRRRSEPLMSGGWIVGYGHTRSAREGVEVTEREAEYLLRYDLQEIEKMVSSAVHAPLNQNEFDALVSFAWNVGRENFHISDVLKYVNAGEMLAAAESFGAWRKARVDGRLIVVDALVRRRAAEKHLFLSHPSGVPSAPSQIIRPELDVAASVLALSDGALSIETKINGDGTIQRTVKEEVAFEAANSNDGLAAAMPLAVSPSPKVTEELPSEEEEPIVEDEALPAVEDEMEHAVEAGAIETAPEAVEDAAETDPPEADETLEVADAEIIDSEVVEVEVVETAAEELGETSDDDAPEAVSEEAELVAGPSIWDATDEAEEYEAETSDLDAADDDEDEDDTSNVDDSLLAAAVIASNLSRRDDEKGAFLAESDEDEDDEPETIAAFADLEAAVKASAEAEAAQAEEIVSELDELEDLNETSEPIEVSVTEDVELIEVEVLDAEELPVVPTEVEAIEVEVIEIEADADIPELVDEPIDLANDEAAEDIPSIAEVQEFVATEAEDDSAEDAAFTPVVTNKAEIFDGEEGESKKKCIVDPLVADHFPDEIAAMDEDAGFSPVSGGRRSGADVWISLIPFVVLVVLGAVMCAFGIFDWWGLISSETPVDKNQLYAGPFLTLVGGLGFLFGIYFIVRKMMGVED